MRRRPAVEYSIDQLPYLATALRELKHFDKEPCTCYWLNYCKSLPKTARLSIQPQLKGSILPTILDRFCRYQR